MFNKRMIFNVIYAIAIVGLISTCFGLFNELFGIAQQRRVETSGFSWNKSQDYQKVFNFYLISFLLCLSATILLILGHVIKHGGLIKDIILAVYSIASSATIIILSVQLSHFLRTESPSWDFDWILSISDYYAVTTLRTAAFSFICYVLIILTCNLVDNIIKRKTAAQDCTETQEPTEIEE